MLNTKNGLIELPNGEKRWYLNGKLHRIDGPAIEKVDGNKEWWLNGKRHRLDGPAVINKDKILYFIDGNLFNLSEYLLKVQNIKSKILIDVSSKVDTTTILGLGSISPGTFLVDEIICLNKKPKPKSERTYLVKFRNNFGEKVSIKFYVQPKIMDGKTYYEYKSLDSNYNIDMMEDYDV